MNSSIFSIISFLVITFIYYAKPSIGKPIFNLTDYENYDEYSKTCILRQGIYFGVVVIVQILINTAFIQNKCGGNVGKNILTTLLITFIPWLLIFGVIIVVLIIYPNFKNVFSDVVGYYVVSSKANKLLSEIMMVDTQTTKTIGDNIPEGEQSGYKYAAEAIMKLSGNSSILINQISPSNFSSMWKMLSPLMKKGFSNDEVKKSALLDIVILKDNVGESMWYIYTAIFLISMISYYISKTGCAKNLNAMKKQHDDYLNKVNIMEEEKQKNEAGGDYTM